MQPPAKDQYAKLASLYQKALSEADTSDDPETYRERARAAYDRAVAKVAQESTPQPAARQEPPAIAEEVRQPMGPAKAIGTVLSTAFPGAPAGAAALGAAFSREPGESFQEAYQRRMREIGEEERQAKEELFPGVGTALQLGTAGAALAKAPLVGARVAANAPVLQKALAAGKRIVGGGLVAGAESAGRQGMDDKELSPAESAALGAGLTAGMEAAFPAAGALIRGASRIPIVGEGATALVRSLAGPTAEAVTQARRGIADYLAPRFGQRGAQLAQMVEPTDITRIQRQAASTLPGGVTGPTTAMMPGGNEAIAQAVRQAEAAAAQAQQQVKSARLATGQATQARTEALERVKTEEGARIALGRQRQRAFGAQAEETERIGKSRRERLLEVAGAEETEAERILREARQAARAAERGGVQAATEAEQAVIQQAEDQAQTFLQRLRVQKGTTKATQKAIKEEKDKVAAANYKTLYGFGSPAEEAQWGLYDEMRDIPGMMAGLRQAAAELRVKGQALGTPPNMIRRMVGSGENAAEETMPELTVELFDKFRQMAREGRVPLPNETGARAQSKMFYKEVVDQFEDALFNQLPAGAREAAQTARKQHRAFFQLLEAAEDGLNLGAAKPGKVSGLLTQNRRELDEVVERVGKMSNQEREIFQTAAREAIDRQIQRSQGEARKVLQRFGSEEMQQKLRLAYGDEMVDELQDLALGQVRQQAKAAGTAARAQATAEAQRLRAEAEAAVTPLTTRAERARALGERARTQGQERARTRREESLAELEGRRQAAQLRLTQTQQATGAPVRQAREAQRAAEEQAAQLAEQLTQARIARSQAKALPMGDLERALGPSTAQQTFLQRTLPQMTAEQRTQAVQVLGSNVQRRLQDLARQGESPERILREINLLKQNDAVRTLFGPQMDAFAQSLVGRQSMLLPFRTAVAGQAAGRF